MYSVLLQNAKFSEENLCNTVKKCYFSNFRKCVDCALSLFCATTFKCTVMNSHRQRKGLDFLVNLGSVLEIFMKKM